MIDFCPPAGDNHSRSALTAGPPESLAGDLLSPFSMAITPLCGILHGLVQIARLKGMSFSQLWAYDSRKENLNGKGQFRHQGSPPASAKPY